MQSPNLKHDNSEHVDKYSSPAEKMKRHVNSLKRQRKWKLHKSSKLLDNKNKTVRIICTMGHVTKVEHDSRP